MPRRTSADRPAQLAGHWLSKRPGSDMWCVTWFDAASRQTRRASLGTRELAEAERELARWVAENVAGRRAPAEEATLARVVARYRAEHVEKLPRDGAAAQRRSLAMILLHAPPGATLAQFNLRAQEATKARMEAAGLSAWTIKRAFGAVKAAVNWAWKHEEIERPIAFLALPEGEGRERVLSTSELARLWDADMPDHVRTFLALMIGTGARPDAVLQLTRFQCDLERGVIDLNPPGRRQTKKRRPKIPMADWLRPFIESASGPVVAYRGRPVRKIAGAFQTLREAAGFGADVTAYTIRHTVATELRARGVPMEQVAALLGHRMPDLRTTERYAHVSPVHLSMARKALETLANDIARAATRAMEPNQLRASCVSVASDLGCNPGQSPTETGAAVGTGE